MKMLLCLLGLLAGAGVSFAQTATDFTTNDCAGNPHNLFNELDNGKVVVLCWVMPCSGCTGPAVTTHNVVQSFQNSHPNRVVMYLADDYGNTSCAALNAWAANNTITNATTFSSAAINMAHYGSAGMPKIVVLGGPNHTVFYNSNNSVNQATLQNAINTALLTSATGVNEAKDEVGAFLLWPNPASAQATISFSIKKSSEIEIAVYNSLGRKVADVFIGKVAGGENQFKFNTAGLSNGLYFVNLNAAGKNERMKLVIAR